MSFYKIWKITMNKKQFCEKYGLSLEQYSLIRKKIDESVSVWLQTNNPNGNVTTDDYIDKTDEVDELLVKAGFTEISWPGLHPTCVHVETGSRVMDWPKK